MCALLTFLSYVWLKVQATLVQTFQAFGKVFRGIFQAPALRFTLLWFTFTHFFILCLDLESKLVMGKVLLGTLSGILYGIVVSQNVIQTQPNPL